MNQQNEHVRNGIGAVRPFVYGRPDLLDFVNDVFVATELERNKIANGFHVQAQIHARPLVCLAGYSCVFPGIR
jgi:hypothetical protein